jgi:reactive chlorine resistance protein C
MKTILGIDGATRLQRWGRVVSLVGVLLPLLLIGGLKFTEPEIEALSPLIAGTPWLSWLHSVFGKAGSSYFLGIVEIAAAIFLMASPWSARAGLIGAGLAILTFLVTSTLIALPMAWDPRLGGFPALGPFGQFVIKDIALLGVALLVAGNCLARTEHETN